MNVRALHQGLRQIVPSAVCLDCDICCRFSEAFTPMRPYFAPEEMALVPEAPEANHDGAGWFPSPQGAKVTLEPHGPGCRCPFFEPKTNGCRIYDRRPLDCRLYPFVLMRDPADGSVVLGMDLICPFIEAHREAPSLVEYGRWLASYAEEEGMVRAVTDNPGLVQGYQETAVVLERLPRLTAAAASAGLKPLTLADQPLIELHLDLYRQSTGTRLSGYAFPALWFWRDLFDYSWMFIDEQLCVLAEERAPDRPHAVFMPLPPLGTQRSAVAVREAFRLMDRRNPNPSLSRIEDVDEGSQGFFEALGFHVAPKGMDYLYRRDDLVALKGNRYRGKRSAYNACVRQGRQRGGLSFEPYRPEDASACLSVFQSWRADRRRVHPDALSTAMLDDAASLHRLALQEAGGGRRGGLMARVARMGGKVQGYIVGYPIGPDTVAVLLEVANHEMTGLAQFLFREFCREQPPAVAFVSAMDDSGLEALRRVKQSYHPARLISSYIVTRP